MFDRIAADLSASGYELGGDVVYYFTPWLGVGFGGGFVHANKSNSIRTAAAELKLFSLQLGLFLSLPLNRWLTFCASAGPVRYLAEFQYGGSVTTPSYIDSINQVGKASHWESMQSVSEYNSGTLYLIKGGEDPQLDIIEGPIAAVLRARKAEFDFSGVSLQAGLNFKF